jgi:hypothetical protein
MPFSPYASAPPQQMGYWRGGSDWPTIGGQGPQVAVNTASIPYWNSTATPGFGSSSSWHPTIGYMLAFVVVEMFVFHHLSKYLNI